MVADSSIEKRQEIYIVRVKCLFCIAPVQWHLLILFQVEESSSISEEPPHAKQWRKPNLFLEIPSRALEVSPKEYVQIKMPPTPTPTPKRVNFLLTPSPSDARVSGSPGPSTRGKPSLKSLLPKLSFKSRISQSDAERAANLAVEASSPMPQDKPSISRSWSLTKIFTPRMKRTSSLPVTPIGHSNPESICGENLSSSATLKVRLLKFCGYSFNWGKEKKRHLIEFMGFGLTRV